MFKILAPLTPAKLCVITHGELFCITCLQSTVCTTQCLRITCFRCCYSLHAAAFQNRRGCRSPSFRCFVMQMFMLRLIFPYLADDASGNEQHFLFDNWHEKVRAPIVELIMISTYRNCTTRDIAHYQKLEISWECKTCHEIWFYSHENNAWGCTVTHQLSR